MDQFRFPELSTMMATPPPWSSTRWDLLLLSSCGVTIQHFLGDEDLQRLRMTSSSLRERCWVLRNCQSTRLNNRKQLFPRAEAREWATAKMHAALTREFYSDPRRHRAPRRKSHDDTASSTAFGSATPASVTLSSSARMDFHQLAELLDQLLLVASGIKPSCLVDANCPIDAETAMFLLDRLEQLGSLEAAAYRGVSALFTDDNVFFVNVPKFVREMHLNLASGFRGMLVVDASPGLASPAIIETVPTAIGLDMEREMSADNAPAAGNEIFRVVGMLCDEMVTAYLSSPSRRVVESSIKITNTHLSQVAVRDVILCNPVVYNVGLRHRNLEDGQYGTYERVVAEHHEAEDNCLGMWRLLTVSAMISDRVLRNTKSLLDEPPLTLQQFFVPVHLLHSTITSSITGRRASRQSLLLARTQRRMEQWVGGSSFADVVSPIGTDALLSIHVVGDVQVLARVAL